MRVLARDRIRRSFFGKAVAKAPGTDGDDEPVTKKAKFIPAVPTTTKQTVLKQVESDGEAELDSIPAPTASIQPARAAQRLRKVVDEDEMEADTGKEEGVTRKEALREH